MSGTGGNCLGLTWSYHAWGNRTAQNVTSGTCNTSSLGFNSSNQIISPSGYQYDLAGDMTKDASHSYSYDAEGRITQVDSGNTATYAYDAQGQRVRKTASSVNTDYVYDVSGRVLAEMDPGWAVGYVYFGGRLLAEYKNSTTYFVTQDQIGSSTLLTNVSGGVADCNAFYPFGEQDSSICATTNTTTHKFTGKERDSESNLDNFGARYYGSSIGRFMSPDPSNAGADPSNPESWNAYAYVLNNPETLTDPTGLDIWLKGCGREDTATCHGGYVGTTDKNGVFHRTHLSGNQTSSAWLGLGGITVEIGKNTYEGVWDTNAGEQSPVTVSGAGDLNAFDFQVTGGCHGTCLAGNQQERIGITAVFYAGTLNAASASDVRAALQGDTQNWYADTHDPFHRHGGKNDTVFMGQTDSGPSTDITVPQSNLYPVGFHINSGYPFRDVVSVAGHFGSIVHTFSNDFLHAALGVPLPN